MFCDLFVLLMSVTGSGPDKDRGTGLRRLLPPVQYEHLFAGVAGGITSTLVLHPLDLLKIRLAGM